jgi:hypothetical protein
MSRVLRFGGLLLGIASGALVLAFGMTVFLEPLLATVFAVVAALLLTGALASTYWRSSPTSDITSRGEEECKRAARYGRSLTLMVVEPAPKSNVRAVQRQLAKWLRSELRAVDVYGHLGNGRYVVLLPETAIAKADNPVARLRRRMDRVQMGLSTFPGDGVTFEQLYAAARNRLGEEPGQGEQAA